MMGIYGFTIQCNSGIPLNPAIITCVWTFQNRGQQVNKPPLSERHCFALPSSHVSPPESTFAGLARSHCEMNHNGTQECAHTELQKDNTAELTTALTSVTHTKNSAQLHPKKGMQAVFLASQAI
jgi:hypothetical protein